MKQLERLLFLQGNRCFFCRQTIPNGEASVEHLAATSNGGTKDDDNCVVCCKTINAALGNLSVKAKLQVVVNHQGVFTCPHICETQAVEVSATPTAMTSVERLKLVIADLVKRGASRPRKELTLRNTINAVFQNKLLVDEITQLIENLRRDGKVIIQDTKVTYNLIQAEN
ncbi:MAG: HNH endonuclease [Burkholderiaceae bacterium]